MIMRTWRLHNGILVRRERPDILPPGVVVLDPRDDLVYGAYEPGPSNTGTRGNLSDYNGAGTQIANVTSGMIENKVIYGDIKWSGSQPLTLKNCLLVGGPHIPSGASGVVDCNNQHAAPIILIDCEVRPREPRNRDCIVGYKWEAYRCNLHRGVDGMGIFARPQFTNNADVIAMGNWVHDLTYIYPDYRNGVSGQTWHTDGTHNDGVQIQGGRNIHLLGNFLDLLHSDPLASNTGPNPDKTWLSEVRGTNGAGLTIQDNTGAGIDTTVVVEKNWFRGGLAQINVKPNFNFVLRNNNHYRDVAINYTDLPGTWNGYWIRIDQRSGQVITGLATNRWVDGPLAGRVMAEPRTSGIHYNA